MLGSLLHPLRQLKELGMVLDRLVGHLRHLYQQGICVEISLAFEVIGNMYLRRRFVQRWYGHGDNLRAINETASVLSCDSHLGHGGREV